MALYNVAEVASHLSELADKAAQGEEVIFTKGADKFQIIRVPNAPVRQPGLGGQGWMAPDFDDPIEDMNEYM